MTHYEYKTASYEDPDDFADAERLLKKDGWNAAFAYHAAGEYALRHFGRSDGVEVPDGWEEIWKDDSEDGTLVLLRLMSTTSPGSGVFCVYRRERRAPSFAPARDET